MSRNARAAKRLVSDITVSSNTRNKDDTIRKITVADIQTQIISLASTLLDILSSNKLSLIEVA